MMAHIGRWFRNPVTLVMLIAALMVSMPQAAQAHRPNYGEWTFRWNRHHHHHHGHFHPGHHHGGWYYPRSSFAYYPNFGLGYGGLYFGSYYNYSPWAYSYYSYPGFGWSFPLGYQSTYFSYGFYPRVYFRYSYTPRSFWPRPWLTDAGRADSLDLAARAAPAVRAAPVRVAKAAEPAVVAARLPAIVEVSLEHDAVRLLRSGDTAFQGGRYGNATEFYKIAAESAPKDPQAYLRAGYALIAQRRYREAYPMLLAGVERSGDRLAHLLPLGELYVDEGSRKTHLEALAKTALENPDDARLLAMVGLFLVHDGQADRANAFFAEASRLSSGDEFISARLGGTDAVVAMSNAAAEVER